MATNIISIGPKGVVESIVGSGKITNTILKQEGAVSQETGSPNQKSKKIVTNFNIDFDNWKCGDYSGDVIFVGTTGTLKVGGNGSTGTFQFGTYDARSNCFTYARPYSGSYFSLTSSQENGVPTGVTFTYVIDLDEKNDDPTLIGISQIDNISRIVDKTEASLSAYPNKFSSSWEVKSSANPFRPEYPSYIPSVLILSSSFKDQSTDTEVSVGGYCSEIIVPLSLREGSTLRKSSINSGGIGVETLSGSIDVNYITISGRTSGTFNGLVNNVSTTDYKFIPVRPGPGGPSNIFSGSLSGTFSGSLHGEFNSASFDLEVFGGGALEIYSSSFASIVEFGPLNGGSDGEIKTPLEGTLSWLSQSSWVPVTSFKNEYSSSWSLDDILLGVALGPDPSRDGILVNGYYKFCPGIIFTGSADYGIGQPVYPSGSLGGVWAANIQELASSSFSFQPKIGNIINKSGIVKLSLENFSA